MDKKPFNLYLRIFTVVLNNPVPLLNGTLLLNPYEKLRYL